MSGMQTLLMRINSTSASISDSGAGCCWSYFVCAPVWFSFFVCMIHAWPQSRACCGGCSGANGKVASNDCHGYWDGSQDAKQDYHPVLQMVRYQLIPSVVGRLGGSDQSTVQSRS
jgi:hypothetical protein